MPRHRHARACHAPGHVAGLLFAFVPVTPAMHAHAYAAGSPQAVSTGHVPCAMECYKDKNRTGRCSEVEEVCCDL